MSKDDLEQAIENLKKASEIGASTKEVKENLANRNTEETWKKGVRKLVRELTKTYIDLQTSLAKAAKEFLDSLDEDTKEQLKALAEKETERQEFKGEVMKFTNDRALARDYADFVSISQTSYEKAKIIVKTMGRKGVLSDEDLFFWIFYNTLGDGKNPSETKNFIRAIVSLGHFYNCNPADIAEKLTGVEDERL